ncbi:Acg family FMN-binding oxidoreductase [Actinacidiphila bryophytorum]|uniref:Acg family FMN-binding oxidoreductase n=1 Tax=Actinacidiphila bryophytorum TaxID=1436133 RepID=UPI002176D633|nr:nitroreductase family protein [Actinacidiphila bryophytorum]UWE10530.1 nitroreductase family protein [Actinacidiphila bryophytorum]
MTTTAALDAATLEKLVSAAVAAPSIHNTQPWRYRLDPDTMTVEVRAAWDRTLQHTDPEGRALHISVGAAVFNLRVAVAHFGWEPVVRLLPRPAEPGLLATVRLAGPRGHTGPAREAGLYDAIWRRHSSRFPFSEQQVPGDVLAEIAQAADAEGAHLSCPRPGENARILQLTEEAERFAVVDPDRGAESRSWVREDAADGMPGAALGPYDSSGHLPMRDFAALRPADRRPSAAFERHPVVAVLATAHDAPADWLRAGQALERALLVATAHQVRASLFSQAVEEPDVRWALRDPRGGHEHVQMLIRFGYGPEGPATPRRPVRDVLDTGGQPAP